MDICFSYHIRLLRDWFENLYLSIYSAIQVLKGKEIREKEEKHDIYRNFAYKFYVFQTELSQRCVQFFLLPQNSKLLNDGWMDVRILPHIFLMNLIFLKSPLEIIKKHLYFRKIILASTILQMQKCTVLALFCTV